MFNYDELMIYRGKDIQIAPQIIITQPSIDDIIEFGEKRYFSAIHTFTAVGADLKWQLWDMGIDYTEIDDYDLFIKVISQIISSKKDIYSKMPEEEKAKLSDEEKKDYMLNPLQLILKDIDFSDFTRRIDTRNNQVVLYDPKRDILIGRAIYAQIVDAIRKMHGLKRNNEIPANERTKMDLIEDARDAHMLSSKEPYKSALLPLISTLSIKSGRDNIWDMKISRFFYDIKRVGKIQDATMLLQSAYSGFANLKGIDKTRLDIWGDI